MWWIESLVKLLKVLLVVARSQTPVLFLELAQRKTHLRFGGLTTYCKTFAKLPPHSYRFFLVSYAFPILITSKELLRYFCMMKSRVTCCCLFYFRRLSNLLHPQWLQCLFCKIKDRVHMAVILIFLLVDQSCGTVGRVGKSHYFVFYHQEGLQPVSNRSHTLTKHRRLIESWNIWCCKEQLEVIWFNLLLKQTPTASCPGAWAGSFWISLTRETPSSVWATRASA